MKKETVYRPFLRVLSPVAVAAAAALIAGCAGPTVKTAATPEEIIRERAQVRAELVQKREYEKAYAYLAPSYRALNDTQAYRNTFGGGVEWVDPKVSKVKCPDADRCIVEIDMAVRVAAPGFGSKPIPHTLFETWIEEDGQWWYFQRK
ncbi:hypothetical protein [Pulveribacter sp.]|uniref:hypothetical protein n=1 Tax=Pulveribacter sp. TaxID=2678893 RepID=UPI0028ADE34E|nr:hypothetical protein [Pulveribacter sp.]